MKGESSNDTPSGRTVNCHEVGSISSSESIRTASVPMIFAQYIYVETHYMYNLIVDCLSYCKQCQTYRNYNSSSPVFLVKTNKKSKAACMHDSSKASLNAFCL